MPQLPLTQYGIAGGAIAVLFVFGILLYQVLNLVQQQKGKDSSDINQTIPPAVLEILQNNNIALQNNNTALQNNTLTLTAMQGTLGKLCDNTTRQGTQLEELLARARRTGGG